MCIIYLNKTAPPLVSVIGKKTGKPASLMLPGHLQKYLTSTWFISAYLEKKGIVVRFVVTKLLRGHHKQLCIKIFCLVVEMS